jgi:ribonuclease VapC
MIRAVLDASAVLTFLQEEPGFKEVERLLDNSCVNAVNIAEVASKLAERGSSAETVREIIDSLGVEVVACDRSFAYRIGDLRNSTKAFGLSLGDRACLATAIHYNVQAVTADRQWKSLKLGVRIHVIR